MCLLRNKEINNLLQSQKQKLIKNTRLNRKELHRKIELYFMNVRAVVEEQSS